MASVNKVILVGNLGADPESRFMPSGEAVCNIRLATTDTWKDKQTGEKREATEWHRVVFYRRLAEIAGQYLKKGSSVFIEGRIRTRKWQDKDGQERYTTEIEATEMQMLGGRSGGGSGAGGGSSSSEGGDPWGEAAPSRSSGAGGSSSGYGNAKPASPPKKDFGADFDDDIPF